MAPVVFECRPEVPTVTAVGRPRFALVGLLMDEDANAWWRDGCGIEIVCTEELCVCRQLGIDAGSTQ
jgi:hypothetical protein